MTIRESSRRAQQVTARVRRQSPGITLRARPPGRRLILREIVAWLLATIIAVGSVTYAYRPWPALWGMVAAVAVSVLLWLPDMLDRRGWRPVTTMTATLGWLLVAYGGVACLNPSFRVDDRIGRLMPEPHEEWMPSAIEATNALPTLAALAAALAVCAMMTDLGKSARLRRRFFCAVAFGGLITAAIGVAEKLSALDALRRWDEASPWFHGSPFGLLSYQNYAATLMNLAMPALAIVGLGGSPRLRVAATLGIVALALAALANVSRTGLALGSIAAALSLFLLWSSSPATSRRWWIAPTVAGASLVALLAAILAVARPAVVARLAQLDSGDRFATIFPRTLHWQAGIELFNRAPLFGIGPGGYRLMMLTTQTKGYYLGRQLTPGDPFNPTANVLNDYVQTLVEWGIVGSALWTMLALGAIRNAFLAIRSPAIPGGRREVALVIVASFALFAHALIDPPLQAPLFQLIAAMIIGTLWAARRWRTGDPIATFFESTARTPSRIQ